MASVASSFRHEPWERHFQPTAFGRFIASHAKFASSTRPRLVVATFTRVFSKTGVKTRLLTSSVMHHPLCCYMAVPFAVHQCNATVTLATSYLFVCFIYNRMHDQRKVWNIFHSRSKGISAQISRVENELNWFLLQYSTFLFTESNIQRPGRWLMAIIFSHI